ncbi:SDR family oxidoreductase [Lactococcus taiwanensis]|uniref:SDR family oxidoreductase n=1 Tax=Lactococcus taiwanensis TaxID=1151742 RepID=A0AA45KGS6_9LACT|nr:SDR family oxidoreductase [Lactococcus taiwanensis]QSE76011.1 SDR family oxidoreductase [Lactococcus taiwanensis]
MEISQKVVVITGASSGIGLATAKLLLARGARLALAARHVDNLRDLSKEYPEQVIVQAVDVAVSDQVDKLIQLTLKAFGRIDVLFNNAAIMPVSHLREGRRQDWQDMLNINIMGVLNGISAVLPIMEAQGQGHILTTDSTAGHKTFPKFAVYSATKYAIRAIMEGLRQEENDKNIKSTLITPGTTSTNLYKTIPSQSDQEDELAVHESAALAPDDVAKAVVYAIDTPDDVSVSEIHIRPTHQIP